MPDALEHTLAHLARLDLLVRREVLRTRLASGEQAADEFRGLYVTGDEVQALLDRPVGAPTDRTGAADPGDLASLDRGIAAVSARIDDLEAAARERRRCLPLVRLAERFSLSSLERDTLVICLAAELDLKYERLYAYLQDDVTKKRPTVDLVMRLLCTSVRDRLGARGSFTPEATLIRWNLITLNEDPGARRSVLLARYLKLDERIAGYLLGSGATDSRLAPLAAPADDGREVEIGADLRARLASWSEAWPAAWADRAPVVLFHGRYGTGRPTAARTLADALGRPLLLLDLAGMSASETGLKLCLSLAEREARLTDAVLGMRATDDLLRPERRNDEDYRTIVQALAQGSVPTILLAERAWEPARDLRGRPFLRLELPEPSYAERHRCWAIGLDGNRSDIDDNELLALAGRFRLTPGQIHDALARARTVAWVRDPTDGRLTIADIDAACRTQAQHQLTALARKLEPRYTWDDIVLPPPHLTSLRLICATVRHRPVVYGSWGFDRRLSLGKGLIALFSGPSGTGKTMAAEIIARDLRLDLYKIDLSAVVSKYIGETEKNLERIFSEAQDSDAILFFDEADALFGKRSEVKDAHDRYANIEIAYLLQRTEEYNGLVILASNVKKSMDEAFVRRLHFTIDFPFPEEPERLEIWRRTFPSEAPVDSDVDLPFLARKLRITGGNIRNVILTAAFLAADDGRRIGMRHLVRGATYEFQKMGKLVVEADFERYFELARPDGARAYPAAPDRAVARQTHAE